MEESKNRIWLTVSFWDYTNYKSAKQTKIQWKLLNAITDNVINRFM